jgi:inorganic pyrophosphatase
MDDPPRLASEWIGRRVVAIIDRPLGTSHPRWPGILYLVNYGYVPGTLSGDGEPVDVYIVGEDRALEEVVAYVVGIVYREDDNEDKLVAARLMCTLTPDDIMKQIKFVEQYFTVTIETLSGRARYDRGVASTT